MGLEREESKTLRSPFVVFPSKAALHLLKVAGEMSTSLLQLLPWGCKGPHKLRVPVPKLPAILHTGDFDNKPAKGRHEIPAPGMDRLQLSALDSSSPCGERSPSLCQFSLLNASRR